MNNIYFKNILSNDSKAIILKIYMIIMKEFYKIKLLKKNDNFSIIFINDNEIKKLNKKYKNKNETTDVLTFLSPDSFDNYLGDIYINGFYVQKYYKSHIYNEIGLIIIHGILHLLKYSHYDKINSKKMFDIQNKIQLNINYNKIVNNEYNNKIT